MANEQHARSSLQASVEVGAAFLVAGTNEIARLQSDLDTLTEAVQAHLAIATGTITGGVMSPTLFAASLLDLRRLVTKD
jgi:hypothetical protein